jgi:hypothetical protein
MTRRSRAFPRNRDVNAPDNICPREHSRPCNGALISMTSSSLSTVPGPRKSKTSCKPSSKYEQLGPQLGRPRVDTLNGSAHANMKEIRFDAADGVWRFAFAFDPNCEAIILCGGDKSCLSTRRFYLPLIAKADERFTAHLAKVKRQKEEKEKRDKKEMKAKKERRK